LPVEFLQLRMKLPPRLSVSDFIGKPELFTDH